MMQTAKEKICNLASIAKKRITICKARVEEQAELATAKTQEEKELATEKRKAKEAQAKMELHQEKAKHAAKKLNSKHRHHKTHVAGTQPAVGTQANQQVGSTATMAGTTAPTYPLGAHAPGHKYV